MKKISKRLGLFCCVGLCTLLFMTNNIPVYASGGSGVEIDGEGRTTNLEWVYATINGELYMRLWNHSTGEWVTDWIPAVGQPDN